MEVNRLRPNRTKRRRNVAATGHSSSSRSDTQRAPDEVLDECEASFKAADERRQKASTKFFTDTGLMALLCRHDRVLWLATMSSAGEKQHYALALIRSLFRHIPRNAVVGILYDIGCQLHRSITKWGLLSCYADRMVFGISVFHAFGHQWACQLVYHPRKCVGFGFTDGEGCERFWSSLKHLIPTLRITGVCPDFSLIPSDDTELVIVLRSPPYHRHTSRFRMYKRSVQVRLMAEEANARLLRPPSRCRKRSS